MVLAGIFPSGTNLASYSTAFLLTVGGATCGNTFTLEASMMSGLYSCSTTTVRLRVVSLACVWACAQFGKAISANAPNIYCTFFIFIVDEVLVDKLTRPRILSTCVLNPLFQFFQSFIDHLFNVIVSMVILLQAQ